MNTTEALERENARRAARQLENDILELRTLSARIHGNLGMLDRINGLSHVNLGLTRRVLKEAMERVNGTRK